MAASNAGVFWRAATPGELAYGHTRTHFFGGGWGGSSQLSREGVGGGASEA